VRKAGLVMAALLGGCATLGDPERRVSEALAEDNYASAAAIHTRITTSMPCCKSSTRASFWPATSTVSA
jgi:hypothetical protein